MRSMFCHIKSMSFSRVNVYGVVNRG